MLQAFACFVCDDVTKIYCQDVVRLRSKHTETPILELLEKCYGHNLTYRIGNGSVVCQNCIIQIDEYDELCMNAMSLEKNLRNLLTATIEKETEIESVDCDAEYIEFEEMVDDEDFIEEIIEEFVDPASDDQEFTEEIVEIVDPVNEDDDETVTKTVRTTKVPAMCCKICERNFDSFTELTNHKHTPKKAIVEDDIVEELIVTAESTPVATAKQQPVGSNKYTFVNFNNVMVHQMDGTKGEPSLKCSLCSLKFFNKRSLKEHYNKVHNGDGRCDFCGCLFSDKEKCKEHIARHDSSKNPLQCVECGKVFKARSPMMRHMGTHTMEKFFICELCGKQFTHYSSLKMHMMAHGDIREKKCDICGLSFRSTSHLNRHKRVHSGAKPYECLICKRSFAQRYNMMSHCKSHSKDTPTNAVEISSHVCSICNANFPNASKLDDHRKTTHNEAAINVES